jgi:hypothetical protein
VYLPLCPIYNDLDESVSGIGVEEKVLVGVAKDVEVLEDGSALVVDALACPIVLVVKRA